MSSNKTKKDYRAFWPSHHVTLAAQAGQIRLLREDKTPKEYIATIVESPFPQYVGKISMAIYRLEKGTLTLTGNEPGNSTVPASFDAPGAARVEVKKQ